jgi:ribosome maturation factor RimP
VGAGPTSGAAVGAPEAAELTALLAPLLNVAGIELEQIEIAAAGRRRVLRVVVDRDGGVDLDSVAEASRAISAALDSSEMMGSVPYVLEVSSPGVDRPLTRPQHWRRAIGRKVTVDLVAGGSLEARVLSQDDEGVDLQDCTTAGAEPRRVSYRDVSQARVQVEFARAGATGSDEDGEEVQE